MTTDQTVYSTVTGQPPADEGRDYIPTRDELRRPYSLQRPQPRGELDRHIKLTPLVLRAVLRECKRRGIKLSDCIIKNETTVLFPNK
jgi:hypothetical protein